MAGRDYFTWAILLLVLYPSCCIAQYQKYKKGNVKVNPYVFKYMNGYNKGNAESSSSSNTQKQPFQERSFLVSKSSVSKPVYGATYLSSIKEPTGLKSGRYSFAHGLKSSGQQEQRENSLYADTIYSDRSNRYEESEETSTEDYEGRYNQDSLQDQQHRSYQSSSSESQPKPSSSPVSYQSPYVARMLPGQAKVGSRYQMMPMMRQPMGYQTSNKAPMTRMMYGQPQQQQQTGYGSSSRPTGYNNMAMLLAMMKKTMDRMKQQQQQQRGYGAMQQQMNGYGQKPMQQQMNGYGQKPMQQMSGYGQKPMQQMSGYGQMQKPMQQMSGYGQKPMQQMSGYGPKPMQQASGYGQMQKPESGYGQNSMQQMSGYDQKPMQQQVSGYDQKPMQQQMSGYGQMPMQQMSGYGQKPMQQMSGYGQMQKATQKPMTGYGQKPMQQMSSYGQMQRKPVQQTSIYMPMPKPKPQPQQMVMSYAPKPMASMTGYVSNSVQQKPSMSGYGMQASKPSSSMMSSVYSNMMQQSTAHQPEEPSYDQMMCPQMPDTFCYGREAGHYTHPGSASCFMQCDANGRAYSKACAPGTSWRATGDTMTPSDFNHCASPDDFQIYPPGAD